MIVTGASIEQGEQTSYGEALAQDYTQEWGEAIHVELPSIELNEIWKYIPEGSITRNMKIISCKWAFEIMMNPDGSKRYKAYTVNKGYEQSDYRETYAPVPKLISFQMRIALAVCHEWELDQMDMVTAFLNLPVVGDVYIELLEGLLKYLSLSMTAGHK
jgi:hypothetical protein